jgi:hypothetical protein
MAYHKTQQELEENPNWHFIELTNMPIDAEKLQQWYAEVLEKMPHLRMNPSKTEYLKPNSLQDNLVGGLHSFGISWPVEQDLPIPPRYAANPELYPETLDDQTTFGTKMKVMEKYKFGYFKELYDTYGEEFFSWARITIHDAAARIDPHIDGTTHLFRLHIPIVTNDNAMFYWGDTPYNFKVGKAYLINTGTTHSTNNKGTTERAHLLSHPVNVQWILDNLV